MTPCFVRGCQKLKPKREHLHAWGSVSSCGSQFWLLLCQWIRPSDRLCLHAVVRLEQFLMIVCPPLCVSVCKLEEKYFTSGAKHTMRIIWDSSGEGTLYTCTTESRTVPETLSEHPFQLSWIELSLMAHKRKIASTCCFMKFATVRYQNLPHEDMELCQEIFVCRIALSAADDSHCLWKFWALMAVSRGSENRALTMSLRQEFNNLQPVSKSQTSNSFQTKNLLHIWNGCNRWQSVRQFCPEMQFLCDSLKGFEREIRRTKTVSGTSIDFGFDRKREELTSIVPEGKDMFCSYKGEFWAYIAKRNNVVLFFSKAQWNNSCRFAFCVRFWEDEISDCGLESSVLSNWDDLYIYTFNLHGRRQFLCGYAQPSKDKLEHFAKKLSADSRWMWKRVHWQSASHCFWSGTNKFWLRKLQLWQQLQTHKTFYLFKSMSCALLFH